MHPSPPLLLLLLLSMDGWHGAADHQRLLLFCSQGWLWAAAMGKKEKEKTKKGVSYNADGTVKTCVFCEIIAEGTRCVYMDEDVAVFPSRAGDAATHLLAVPRRHITSIHTVSREVADAEGLLRALDVRHKLFSPEEVERSVAVFHRPPFTSIDHLHLHILVGDYSTLKARLKHTPGGCWRRWNLSLQEAHARLAACKL